MRRNTIPLVWLGGIVLAALVYLAGPAHFIGAVLAALDQLSWNVQSWIDFAARQSFDLVRAIAIGLFAIFLALGVMAAQRGRGSGLIGVTVLFLGLVVVGGYESRLAWLAALLVAGAGALSMTRRLTETPRRESRA